MKKIYSSATDWEYRGIEKYKLWEKLHFILSLSGMNLMGSAAVSVNIKENLIKVPTTHGRMGKFVFKEKLYIFGNGNNIEGLPEPINLNQKKLFKVYDWIDIHNGMNIKIDFFRSPDNFISEILFYPSDRIFLNEIKLRKDALSISTLSEEELTKGFEFSGTNAAYKTKMRMRELGLKGRLDDKKNPMDVEIENVKREIFPLQKLEYQNEPGIGFVNSSLEDLLKLQKKNYSYSQQLLETL